MGRAWAAGGPGGRVFPDLGALGATCDAVSGGVPTDHHAEVALQLLAGGSHLLIEKPLCASLAEAEQVLAAAREAGRLALIHL